MGITVAEIVASVPRPAALVDAERELADARRQLDALGAEQRLLWPAYEGVGIANQNLSSERRQEVRVRWRAIAVEVQALSKRSAELQQSIEAARPIYLAALAVALNDVSHTNAQAILASIEIIERAAKSIGEINAHVVKAGGKAVSLPGLPALGKLQEAANGLLMKTYSAKRAA